ncbi:hypothetical protein [Siphonobacter sp. SORGH_AS_0500]|uniref:hypothetical protein n=1 Tax=Siphonobacter sp. SORGH_AS_0500 TaxID=1864824 RepID=UPI00285B41E4|nr:hypothetical protein [Siphonobacter sp. SORGH_AS_0500]MDR6195656.1 hypothetical protein [Siphonobacter sp. SORGH_AS_0500]
MDELLIILRSLNHLQGFRIIDNELVFQWQGAEVLFWITQDEGCFQVYAGGEKQFKDANPYKVAQFLSILGL